MTCRANITQVSKLATQWNKPTAIPEALPLMNGCLLLCLRFFLGCYPTLTASGRFIEVFALMVKRQQEMEVKNGTGTE